MGIVRKNCIASEACNATRAMGGGELKHLKKATEELEMAQRRLVALSKRMKERAGD